MPAPSKSRASKSAATAPDVTVELRALDGSSLGETTLPGAVFGIEPNTAVMHQVVTAQLAAARSGTHSTRTRAQVRGGGAKPWQQKGTGRSRQGSIRSPHWTGGGVAHGPKPRDYSQRTPKKMIGLALRSALSDRAGQGTVVVVDRWSFDEPRTRVAKEALAAFGVAPRDRVLVVLDHDDAVTRKSFRNLEGEQRVRSVEVSQLNAYEVLVADWVVLAAGTLEALTERLVGVASATHGEEEAG